eukprot:523231-Amphidinium_carterae.1
MGIGIAVSSLLQEISRAVVLQEQTNRVNEEFRDLLQSNRFAGSPSQRFMGSPSGSLLALRTNPPSMRSIEA